MPFKLFVEGEKVPVPVVVHDPVFEPPPITALKDAFGLLAQVNKSGPAFTNGAGVIVIITFCEIGVQPFVDVNVSVTFPAAVSTPLGL